MDLADKAILWMRQQKSMAPDKPFFAYVAPGATHAPHHVPSEWVDKYKGKFDQGWDAAREATFARQRELGVIPPEAELTAPENASILKLGWAQTSGLHTDLVMHRLQDSDAPSRRPARPAEGGDEARDV